MKLRPLLLAVPLMALALPAPAYIEAMNSLKGVFAESDVIARAVVDAVSAEKKVVILKVLKPVKGKTEYEKIKIDLNAGPEWHPDAVLRHATVGAPVSLFYHKDKNTGKADVSLIYLNRFFLTAQPDDVMWRLGKIELRGGAKALKFRSSARSDYYFYGTMTGAFVGVRWYSD